MAIPERPHPTGSSSPTKSEILAKMKIVDVQLERTDEIENPIERTFKREALLEAKDQLQAELDPSEPDHTRHE